MKSIRRHGRSIGVFMTILTIMMSVPFQSALAALIRTETVFDAVQGTENRDRIKQFLAREDVRSVILAQGVDPSEAQARVDSLTDAEVMAIADQIDQLPAGGDAIGFAIGILLIILLVVVIARLI